MSKIRTYEDLLEEEQRLSLVVNEKKNKLDDSLGRLKSGINATMVMDLFIERIIDISVEKGKEGLKVLASHLLGKIVSSLGNKAKEFIIQKVEAKQAESEDEGKEEKGWLYYVASLLKEI
jgi:hypothetical protein